MALSWAFLSGGRLSRQNKTKKGLCIFDRLDSFHFLAVTRQANFFSRSRGTIIAGCAGIG
jgi:hypothetical protein